MVYCFEQKKFANVIVLKREERKLQFFQIFDGLNPEYMI